MNVQVKSGKEERPILSPADQARREASTGYNMKLIGEIAASGHPDDIKVSYIRIILHNWRTRMKIIDEGGY